MSAHELFDIGARTITSGIIFLSNASNIVYSKRVWSKSKTYQHVPLVEFDGDQHILRANECALFVHIEWPMPYRTKDIILNKLEPVFTDSEKLAYISGCYDDYFQILVNNSLLITELRASLTSNEVNVLSTYVPKVFDTIIFNDEVDLLLLRLRYMSSYVDHHVIVESAKTFTGRPKRLYYDEVRNTPLFAEYKERITHVSNYTILSH